MIERKTHHATFTIEKTYPAAPARVFRAFADPEAKAQWFSGPEEWDKGPSSFDFREGGRERATGGPKGGQVHRFECLYYDIVPDQRIVYAYEMYLDAVRISVSLTTVELKPADGGTKLIFTEQGVFLDGFDNAKGREEGSRWLLDKLGAALEGKRAGH
jgi:uncharacterized protein YndB with AHSA1/START domain